eukprot:CAMPEP_0167761134 /NCGR_PEP_ID=MMETSP0110_2-20121227/11990_1 /TAXON_ID=629695 /ORGANISM="Gymnochlora sp., Strain CCMP2014" /LENGTH=388 /DNA_ID=CAMNT_0007647757 /DNA_START=46 /DNA_END=1212 /DNA_ORIENTATION=-
MTKKLAAIRALHKLLGNSNCTDCSVDDVSWAVLNLGFFVCVNCAGVHRGLGVEYSQVRSTELDVDCWDEKILEEFRKKGNELARKTYEAAVPCYHITPRETSHSAVRKYWIERKYKEKAYTADKKAQTIFNMPERARIGWLFKRNDAGKWQKRYFVLFREKLSYFRDSATSLPSGSILMHDAKITIPKRERSPKETEHDKLKFVITTDKRTLHVSPVNKNIEDVMSWCHALRRSSLYFGEHKSIKSPRVNEKKSMYGTLAKDLQYEGPLDKQGGSFMTWKTRWFVLSKDVLYYFKCKEKPKENDMSAGSISLFGCDIVEEPDSKMSKSKISVFRLLTPERTFFFLAKEETRRLKWIEVLSKSISNQLEKKGTKVDFHRKSVFEMKNTD